MADPASTATDERADAAPTTAVRRPPDGDRLVFLDALRGFALVFMVLNHTARWWQDGKMTWPRYYWIYATMAIAAPIFLFLVGFCLPLSKRHASEHAGAMLWKYAKRAGDWMSSKRPSVHRRSFRHGSRACFCGRSSSG